MVASRTGKRRPSKKLSRAFTGSAVSSAIERSLKRRCKAMVLRRAPWQLGQSSACSPSSAGASSHCASSPVCSASNWLTRTPVPKQLAHQPWLELNDSSRGSGSGKPRAQDGQARRALNVCSGPLSGSTCTTPLPISSACSTAARNALSCRGPQVMLATGSSMSCSTKRLRLGNGSVFSHLPSTRSSAAPRAAAQRASSR